MHVLQIFYFIMIHHCFYCPLLMIFPGIPVRITRLEHQPKTRACSSRPEHRVGDHACSSRLEHRVRDRACSNRPRHYANCHACSSQLERCVEAQGCVRQCLDMKLE
jgi:hypothetical protein